MKKSLFFYAAATALMLTACSSEDDILQTGPEKKAAPQEVGFDVYTQAATQTRAGLKGTMTTGRLQRSEANGGGFGIYAFLTEDTNGDAGTDYSTPNATSYIPTAGQDPNFMVNEKVLWDSKSQGWYYNPLKYWPNETDNDSQATPAYMESDHQSGSTPAYDDMHLDRLTFFAYAPWVTAGSGTTGILAITDKNGQLRGGDVTDPTISYASTDIPTDVDPDKYVDLLWGVAPSGDLEYTAVNGWTVTKKEGTPLINMIKPNVNTSMKFLFNHALARFGITVIAAVDQVSPGGTLDPNTKITIEKLTISGPFGITGDLNLNNGDNANIANWTYIEGDAINSSKKSITTTQSITVTANGANKAIAPHLRWTGPHDVPVAQPVVGVTTAKQDLLRPSDKWFAKLASTPTYNPAKEYLIDDNGTYKKAEAKYTTTKKGEVYKLSDGKYVAVDAGTPIDAPVYPYYDKDGESSTYYTVTEDKTYPGNYPNGENSYSKVRYKFESYGEKECTNKYGEGIVEVVAVGTSKTRVKVLENDANADYKDQEYWVDGTSFTPNAIYRLQQPSNNPLPIWVKVIQEVKYGYNDTHLPTTTVLYKKMGSGTDVWYEYAGKKADIEWDKNTNTYVTLNDGSKINVNDFNYVYDTTKDYYEAERNYLYVVPTNNVAKNTGLTVDQEKALRTITVQIEYYITTEDSKLNAGRAQTKNVITKEVVLPSLANGKSYNLNMVLGLTSVKVEAEVDDWKVENVQADLPQNTAE